MFWCKRTDKEVKIIAFLRSMFEPSASMAFVASKYRWIKFWDNLYIKSDKFFDYPSCYPLIYETPFFLDVKTVMYEHVLIKFNFSVTKKKDEKKIKFFIVTYLPKLKHGPALRIGLFNSITLSKIQTFFFVMIIQLSQLWNL